MMLGEAATPSAAAMVVTAASRSAGGGEPSASPSLLATSPPGLPPNELSASSSSPSSSSPQHKKPRNHSSLLSSCSSSCCSCSCSSSSCELQRQKIRPLQEPPNYAYFSSSSPPYSTIAPGVYLLDEPLPPPSSSSTTKLFLSASSSSSSSKRKRTDSSSSSSRGEVLLEELQKLKLSLKPKYVLSYDDLAFEEELGAGFFGIVYKGRLYHNNHNGGNAEQQHSTVAIKKITRQTFRNENEIQLFKKEFEILAKLRHDHIIRFIGVGISEATGEHCIVTEYMAGGSLRQYLDHSFESLTETMRRSIARGVASAMKYLHNHEPKIIHRDLSSSNILLDEDPHMAKISDLGLARFLDAGSGMMTCAVGALAWMAPEVFCGKPYSEKADVYSFGICLAELMTGADPYQNMIPQVYASLAATEDLRPTLPEDLPEHWLELIHSCWEKNEALRPTFTEIVAYLDLYLPTTPSFYPPSPLSSFASSSSVVADDEERET